MTKKLVDQHADSSLISKATTSIFTHMEELALVISVLWWFKSHLNSWHSSQELLICVSGDKLEDLVLIITSLKVLLILVLMLNKKDLKNLRREEKVSIRLLTGLQTLLSLESGLCFPIVNLLILRLLATQECSLLEILTLKFTPTLTTLKTKSISSVLRSVVFLIQLLLCLRVFTECKKSHSLILN